VEGEGQLSKDGMTAVLETRLFRLKTAAAILWGRLLCSKCNHEVDVGLRPLSHSVVNSLRISEHGGKSILVILFVRSKERKIEVAIGANASIFGATSHPESSSDLMNGATPFLNRPSRQMGES
jgi:hypothetical protein